MAKAESLIRRTIAQRRLSLRRSEWWRQPSACPICRTPFRDDSEVGPVPDCDCGERGQNCRGVFGNFGPQLRKGVVHDVHAVHAVHAVL